MVKQGATPKGMQPKLVEKIVDAFLKKYKGANDGIQVRVHRGQPALLGDPREDRAKAGFIPAENTLLLVASHLDGPADLIRTLQHEILVHKGLGFFEEKDIAFILGIVKSAAEADAKVKMVGLWRRIH